MRVAGRSGGEVTASRLPLLFLIRQATLGVSANIRSRLFSSNSWASGHVRAIQEAGGMRAWRGHWSRRWSAIVPAYHWGFVSYWGWTAVTMYLYDHHQVRQQRPWGAPGSLGSAMVPASRAPPPSPV